MTITVDHEIFKTLPDKPLLRVDEVAVFFDVKSKTIYRWYDADKLKGLSVTGFLRIYRQSVVDLVIASNGKKNTEEPAAEVEEKLNCKKKSPLRPRASGWVKNY